MNSNEAPFRLCIDAFGLNASHLLRNRITRQRSSGFQCQSVRVGPIIDIFMLLIFHSLLLHSQLGSDLLTKPNWNARVSSAVSALVSAGVASSDAEASLSVAILQYYRKLVIADQYYPRLVYVRRLE